MTKLTVDEAADLLKVREEENGGYVRVLTWGKPQGFHTWDPKDGPVGTFWKTERVFELWRKHGVQLLPLDEADVFFGCVLETKTEGTTYRFSADIDRVRWFLGDRPCQHPNRVKHGRHEWCIGERIGNGLQMCRACGALGEAGAFDVDPRKPRRRRNGSCSTCGASLLDSCTCLGDSP